MARLFKAILAFFLFGFLGLVGYAYLGDMRPVQAPVTLPVTLNVD